MASVPLFTRRRAPAAPEAPTPSGSTIGPPPRLAAVRDPRDELPAHRRPRSRAPRARAALRAVLGTSLLVAATLAIVWAWSEPALAGAFAGLRWLEAHNDGAGRAVATVGVITAGALALVLAWSRATAPRRPVRLADGHGTIAVDEVERRLEQAWLEQPDVIAVRAAVENRHRHGVRVAARIAVGAHARLHETAASATVITELLLEHQLGVALAAPPRFELRYRELDLRAGRAHDIRAARTRARDAEADDAH